MALEDGGSTSEESEAPLDIDQIETSALGREKVVVRIVGHWRGRRRAMDGRVFLVVEADGRRHRFPAIPEPRRSRFGRPGQWSANFAVPAWLEPRLAGQMSLWIGNEAIALPSLEGDGTAEAAQEVNELEGLGEGTANALRAELKERAVAEAQLRGQLAGARAELDGRAAGQDQLEAAQADLRAQLAQLVELVEQEDSRRSDVESRAVVLAAEVADLQSQVGELRAARDTAIEELAAARAELAQTAVAREAAAGEAAGLRAELERLGGELAVARGAGEAGGHLEEAQALLEEARALSSRLRERSAPGAGA